MKKVLIISNIPSPYRTALFRYLQTEQKDYRFQVLYTSRAEADRAWSTQQELEDTFFQDSKVLSVKGGRHRHPLYPHSQGAGGHAGKDLPGCDHRL